MKVLKNLIFYIFILSSLFIAFFVCGYIYVYNYADIVISDDSFYRETVETNIYDKDDELIYTFSGLTVDSTDYEDINPYYFEALVALEDNNYVKHTGVDFIGMAKGVIRTVTSDRTVGGSTITMQLGKLVYMEDWLVYNEDGYSRHDLEPINYKLTQMSVALQLENVYSKEEIIENYANTVFFGDGGYGITRAANTFFHKTPEELTLKESAMLAAIPNSPYGLSPYTNLEDLEVRANYGIQRMFDLGYIDEEEYEAGLAEEVTIYAKDSLSLSSDDNDILSYAIDYYDYLLDELKELAPDINLYTANLDIYTTIDLEAQKSMNDAIKDTSYKQEGVQQGAIEIDPNNGEVRAVSSRTDEDDIVGGYNLATELTRQPGSSIKPVLDYAPAIEWLGYTKDSILDDITTYYSNSDVEVSNYSGTHKGDISLADALRSSLNTTAVRLFQEFYKEVGRDGVVEYMQSLGFTDTDDLNESYAIGGFNIGTSPLQMAASYQMFANGGDYYEPHAIRKIVIDEESPYFNIPEEYTVYNNMSLEVIQTEVEAPADEQNDEDTSSEEINEDEETAQSDESTTSNNTTYEYQVELTFFTQSSEIISEKTAKQITEILDASHEESIAHDAWVDLGDTLAIKTGTSNVGSNARDVWTVGYTSDRVIALWTGFENNENYINEAEMDKVETFKDIID